MQCSWAGEWACIVQSRAGDTKSTLFYSTLQRRHMSDLESSQRSTISSNVRLSGPRTMSSRTNRGLRKYDKLAATCDWIDGWSMVPIDDLINKSFQIHTSTPLRGFLSGRRNLYRYEESLTTTLCDGLLLKPASSSVASTAGDQNIKGVLDSVHMETFTIPDWPSCMYGWWLIQRGWCWWLISIVAKPGVILIVKTRMHKADRPIEHQFYMIPSIGQEDDLSGKLSIMSKQRITWSYMTWKRCSRLLSNLIIQIKIQRWQPCHQLVYEAFRLSYGAYADIIKEPGANSGIVVRRTRWSSANRIGACQSGNTYCQTTAGTGV